MKCPHCCEDIGAGQACGKCGKDAGSFQEMEVQYKDFKLSELLDIKVTKHVPAGEAVGKPEPAQEKNSEGKKKISIPYFTVLIIVLAAIAGFWLLRLLLKF